MAAAKIAAHFLQNYNILNTYSTKSEIFVNCAHLISRKHKLKPTHTHTNAHTHKQTHTKPQTQKKTKKKRKKKKTKKK